MAKYRLDKLVRSRIAYYYEDHGAVTIRLQLEGLELLAAILAKISEESSEISPSAPKADQEKEAADLLQAFEDYVAVAGLDPERIKRLKESRLAEKGGFEDGSFLGIIEVEDGSYWDEYFANDPRATIVE